MEAKDGTEIEQSINKAFEAWKEKPEEPENIKKLDEAVKQARESGIALVLGVNRKVLDNKGNFSVAVSKKDAELYGNIGDQEITFEVHSGFDKNTALTFQTRMDVKEFRGFPSVILKTSANGAFGYFLANEVTSLKVK